MEITLPWFNSKLSPNKRGHWGIAYKPKKAQKEGAYWSTIESLQKTPNFIRSHSYLLDITFHPPDKRRRDRDNNLASIKSALDGIALALGVDDNKFDYGYVKRGEPVKGGKIIIKINGQ